MATPDITVMGAGIFGLSIAYRCAARGARVQVIDPNGVASGSSGGPVGALSPHTPENWNPKKQFQFESLVMAEAFWTEIDTLSGQSSGYGRIGRLQVIDTPRAEELARARQVSAPDFWGDLAEWRVIKRSARWAPRSPTGLLVYDTLSARIDPLRACHSLATALKAKGGVITKSGTQSGQTIWATGHQGLLDIASALQSPVGNGVKGQAMRLEFAAGDVPQIYADGLYIVPHINGTVGIGSTSEREFEDASSTDAQLEALHARAIDILPLLSDAPVLKRWAGVRPRARSRAPMLGPWPGKPGHFIANGGFKIGFGMAPKIADVLADFALDGTDTIPDGFRVEDSL